MLEFVCRPRYQYHFDLILISHRSILLSEVKYGHIRSQNLWSRSVWCRKTQGQGRSGVGLVSVSGRFGVGLGSVWGWSGEVWAGFRRCFQVISEAKKEAHFRGGNMIKILRAVLF